MTILKQVSECSYAKAWMLNTMVDDVIIEQASHFNYLGAVTSVDGTLEKDLDSRIGKVSGFFKSLYCVWYNHNILTQRNI